MTNHQFPNFCHDIMLHSCPLPCSKNCRSKALLRQVSSFPPSFPLPRRLSARKTIPTYSIISVSAPLYYLHALTPQPGGGGGRRRGRPSPSSPPPAPALRPQEGGHRVGVHHHAHAAEGQAPNAVQPEAGGLKQAHPHIYKIKGFFLVFF